MTNNTTEIVTFEVGKAYSYLPYGGVKHTVKSRTDKTITFDGEGRRKIKFVTLNGKKTEYVAIDEYCNITANQLYMTEEEYEAKRKADAEARIKAQMEKEEAERKARCEIQIPEKKNPEAEHIDKEIIMAWTIGNDIENLVRYAKRIDTGNVMICQNTEMNHRDKILYFDGMKVYIHEGVHDKYTTMFSDNIICGTRDSFKDSFKIEAQHDYKYGFRIDKDGHWTKNGKEFQPDWESMNN